MVGREIRVVSIQRLRLKDGLLQALWAGDFDWSYRWDAEGDAARGA